MDWYSRLERVATGVTGRCLPGATVARGGRVERRSLTRRNTAEWSHVTYSVFIKREKRQEQRIRPSEVHGAYTRQGHPAFLPEALLRLLWSITLTLGGTRSRGRWRLNKQLSGHLNYFLNREPDQTQPEYPHIETVCFLP